jgi:hypothetical protein
LHPKATQDHWEVIEAEQMPLFVALEAARKHEHPTPLNNPDEQEKKVQLWCYQAPLWHHTVVAPAGVAVALVVGAVVHGVALALVVVVAAHVVVAVVGATFVVVVVGVVAAVVHVVVALVVVSAADSVDVSLLASCFGFQLDLIIRLPTRTGPVSTQTVAVTAVVWSDRRANWHHRHAKRM